MSESRASPIDADQRIEVSVMVRPRHELDELEAKLGQAQPGEQPYLSREEFAARYGADPADLAKVADFARQHGLTVVESNPARRTVHLEGRAADISAAFGVELRQQRLPDGTTFRGYDAEITVPKDLQAIILGVFGLDNRPVARREIIPG